MSDIRHWGWAELKTKLKFVPKYDIGNKKCLYYIVIQKCPGITRREKGYGIWERKHNN